MLLYALHSSEIMVVPGVMYCVMIGIKVFLLLSGTTIMNESLLPRSMPQNTQ